MEQMTVTLTTHMAPYELALSEKVQARASRFGIAPNALARLKKATGIRYDAIVKDGAVRLVVSHCELDAKGYPIFNSRTVFEEIGAFPDMGALLAHCEGMLARIN